jgi:hypothetical protein
MSRDDCTMTRLLLSYVGLLGERHAYGPGEVLSQSCFFESFGVCKPLNLREPIFGFYP